jgi:hypothetical protein
MYALNVLSLLVLAATVVFLTWSIDDKGRQRDVAYVQSVEDMYGTDVEELIDEGQITLTGDSAEGGRDHCFGPEAYRVVADSVGEPDSLLCFGRDRYREIVEFMESEDGEVIGRDMEEDTLAVVFEESGPFGISCTVPESDATELHCAL